MWIGSQRIPPGRGRGLFLGWSESPILGFLLVLSNGRAVGGHWIHWATKNSSPSYSWAGKLGWVFCNLPAMSEKQSSEWLHMNTQHGAQRFTRWSTLDLTVTAEGGGGGVWAPPRFWALPKKISALPNIRANLKKKTMEIILQLNCKLKLCNCISGDIASILLKT